MSNWTFFTNHGHVLFAIALNPKTSVREISEIVGITQRAVLKILSDLDYDDFLTITKDGRKNLYTLHTQKHLRHDIERDCTIGDILSIIKKTKTRKNS